MLAILAPILVFGLVIFVHELGHFIAAKAVGVYAPRFSIGFGRPIFKRRRGETEYILAWLPLGGYVRMASRHDAEAAFLEGGNEEAAQRPENDPDYDPNAMIPFGPKPVPEDRWFESKPLWARIVIMIAGVTMNAILAFVVATGLATRDGDYVYPSTKLGAVHDVASAPALARLQRGDSIKSVNGTPVHSWNDVQAAILDSKDSTVLATQRGAVVVPLGRETTPRTVANALAVYIPPVIDSVVPDQPASRAGIQSGDSILSVAGQPVYAWTDIAGKISSSPGQPVTFVLRRGLATDTVTVTPAAITDTNESGETVTVGRIGVAARDISIRQPIPLSEGMKRGAQATKIWAGQIFTVLHRIGSGQQSVKELGGPIAITRAAVSAARTGWYQLFYLIGLLSINVAVLNLLPIPILDGGQILINVLESAKGSPFSMRTREYILRFGLLAIALLFAIVMYNDTHAGIAKVFGWIGRLFGA
jgi:regulator of sigma E protease